MSPGPPVALLILSFLSAATAAAQPYSDLAGRILDQSEAGIPDASITVVNEDTGFRRAAESEPGGSYAIGPLEPGSYKITVRKQGFRTAIRFGVRLAASSATRACARIWVWIDFESCGNAPFCGSSARS